MNYSPISETTLNFKLIALLPLYVLYPAILSFSKTKSGSDFFLIIICLTIICWIILTFRKTSKVYYCTENKKIKLKNKGIIQKYKIDELSNCVSLFSNVNKNWSFYTMFYIEFEDVTKTSVKFILNEDNEGHVKTMKKFRFDIARSRSVKAKNRFKK
jgi:hypothetical protein